MQRESESEENVSWNEIAEVLDTEMSTVEDIRADLARNDKGNTCQTINNCMLVFQRDPLLKGAIRKNELSGKIDIVGNLGWQRTSSSLTDTDVYQIHWCLEKNYGLKNDRNINKAMNIVASENRYHPIRDCLEKLKWDGQPRIDNLLPRYLGADHDDYTKEIMRLLMMAAIRRVYEPGCKFEIMVCLVGGQGAGKSTFFRFLAINDEWFSDDLKRMDDDNVYRKMQGHWIIEMSEMMATPGKTGLCVCCDLFDLFRRDEFIRRVVTEIVGRADDKIGAGHEGYILLHAEAAHKGTQCIEQRHRQCQRHHHQHRLFFVSSQIGKGHLMELRSPGAALFFLGLHRICIFGSLHRRNPGCHFPGLGAGQKHRQQGKQHGANKDHRRSADGGDACIQLGLSLIHIFFDIKAKISCGFVNWRPGSVCFGERSRSASSIAATKRFTLFGLDTTKL